jgi:tetratricopeptide (TPR) repeat protein
MVIELKGYRVFVASPGGLQPERKAFREALIAFNEAHAVQKGAVFLPIGWEEIPGGRGRAQGLINEQIRTCDYFVLVLWDRWGMPPGTDGKYTSGTEEEFDIAEACAQAGPMKDIVILFKAVDPKQLSDPGPQLTHVLDFKKKLEEGRNHFFENFDDERTFLRLLDRHLGQWLREHEGAPESPATLVSSPNPTTDVPARAGVEGEAANGRATLKEAWKLVELGRRTDAEALFAREVVKGESPLAFLAYGQFLRRDGRRAQARTMVERALELSRETGNRDLEADASLELGLLLEDQGELNGAEESCRTALKLYEEGGRESGIADCLRNIGLLFARKGDLLSAERTYREALAIDERLSHLGGMADDYTGIGDALSLRGDLARAAEMHQKALELNEKLERWEAVAKNYGDLGNVELARGDLEGAEVMFRKAISLDEMLGRRDVLADGYSNLGSVLYARGDLTGAEEAHLRAADIDERLERFSGLADHYENLALIYAAREDGDGAARFTELARAASEHQAGS